MGGYAWSLDLLHSEAVAQFDFFCHRWGWGSGVPGEAACTWSPFYYLDGVRVPQVTWESDGWETVGQRAMAQQGREAQEAPCVPGQVSPVL